MANDAAKTVTLKTFDGKEFVVSEAVAMQFQTIRHMIEDDCAQDVIPLPNVKSGTLAMIIEYCTKHLTVREKAAEWTKGQKAEEKRSAAMADTILTEELKKWDTEFLEIDTDRLYDLINATNYLDVRDLFDLTCKKVAEMIMGKHPDEIREIFNIKNDFSPEEEEEIRRESGWSFEN
jgi:S-phase kinase-associated protein 1